MLVVSDLIAVTTAVSVAQMIKLGRPVTAGDYASLYYSLLSAFVIAVWMLLLAVYRTRSPRIVGAGTDEFRRVISASLAVTAAIAITFMVVRPEYARGYVLVALPLGLVALVFSRSACRRYLARQRRRGRCTVSVVAVGDAHSVLNLTRTLSRAWWFGYKVVGVCLTDRNDGTLVVPGVGAIPVLGTAADVETAIVTAGADTVAFTGTDHLGPDGVRELSWRLASLNIDLVVSPGVVDVAGPRLTMRPVDGLPIIHVEEPQYNGSKKFQKRAFDLGMSIFVLALASPLMLMSAVAIKLTSKGPVFYRSERIGLDGRPFEMIKFRTMTDDADQQVEALAAVNESEGGVLFKLRDDPRVTGVGRLLRRYSIDELPQFFNVLTKDMSVVGPRPPLRREVDRYDDTVRRRLLVLPGITGLWQISGRSDLSWEDTVRLDLSYVENWSLASDILIAAKTVKTILSANGAY